MIKESLHITQYSLSKTFKSLTDKGVAVAMWKLPHERETKLLLTENYSNQLTKVDLTESKPGFAIAPFESENGKAYFLPADLLYSFPVESGGEKYEVVESISRHFNIRVGEDNETKTFSGQFDIVEGAPESKKYFEDLVNVAIDSIHKGIFEKVVLSRKQLYNCPSDYNVFDHFEKLLTLYPDAFVSLVYLPWLDEFWLGATPELLVHQSPNCFKTVALAGTQSAVDKDGKAIAAKDALWRQKEIEEQALVSRYIINRFKKVRVREFKEIGPKTIKAGALHHLKTTFEVPTDDIGFKELGTVMLELLHPTSAVCGLPKEPALTFIKQNENYDRSFYSGFLGPVQINNESSLFVNLRNLKLMGQILEVYAGCGITKDSEPSVEWNETVLKMNTILGTSFSTAE